MLRHDWLPRLLPARPLMLMAVAALAAACSPQIGDECSVSTDCSSTGDRLCDTTQPGGYCTIFNCEPDSCPAGSICIGFQTSTATGCEDPQRPSRFQRFFCMALCDSKDDCRGGYDCINMRSEGADYRAEVIENGGRSRVCAVRSPPADDNQSLDTGVCEGTDTPIDDEDKYLPVEPSDEEDGG